MKTLIKLLVLATAVISIYAQGYKAPTLQGNAPSAQYLLNNGSQGKEFIFCLPLNDCMPCPTTARNIYITSSKNTTFTYEIVGTGFKRVFQVKAFKVTTLDQNDVPIPEIELSETNSDDVIRITSKDNLSVYVYNGKQVSSDGYLAIPVRSWGKSYMNLGYPDFSEVRPWRAGFAIVAAENATNVTITLRSKNYGVCAASGVNNTTEGGKKYGQSWKISLNKGQAYLVQGDGKTRGLFDLSGSTVTSDKPIGFITYTRRTMIPYGTNPGGRDHTCEMVPPTDKWGKNYVTVEVLRGGKGDLYRAVPLYDGTTIAVKCYDFKDQRLLQTALKPNLRSGEAVEMPVEPAITNGQGPGYKGMCVWSANKPFFLMHLNASTAWDNAPNNDPFMIYCVPTEQFTTATIFQSPDNPVYKEHYFNLIAIGDTNDPSYAKLRTIKLDDKYIFNITPSFLGNHIPGTNFWYTRIPVANGPHVITGDAPFGGDIYGYGSFDSYGWPAATAYRNLAIWDTLPPVPTRSEDCGDYTYKVTETRNFKINDTLDQVETGVVDIDFLDDPRNSNYEFEFLTSDGKIINDNELPDEEKNAIVEFRLKVIDKSKDAFAIFHMTDRALNRTIDSVSWSAPKLKVQPDPVLFGNVRVGKSKTLDVTVTNPTDSTLTVTEIRMKSGQVFSVQSDSIPKTGLLIPPHGTITLKVTYKPDKEGETDLNFDFDSVLIKDKCAPFRIYVKGRGVIPKIIVADVDFGIQSINSTTCYTQVNNGKGFSLRNVGTDTLTVTGFDNTKVAAPFTFNAPYTPPFPIVIPPGGEVFMKEVCFNPTSENSFVNAVPFISDAVGIKEVSIWKGSSVAPGPIVRGNHYDSVRIGTTKVLPCIIYNSGTDKVECTQVSLEKSDDFSIASLSRNPTFTLFGNNSDTALARVAYSPTYPNEGIPQVNFIVGEFTNTTGVRKDSLTGVGYIEKIATKGAEFKNPQLIGTSVTSSIDDERVTINNTSTSRWLTVHGMHFDATRDPANDYYPEDFQFAITPPTRDTVLEINGNTWKIPVIFTPSGKDRRRVKVIIEHNAESAKPNPTGDTVSIVEVIGYGYNINQPIMIPHSFGDNLRCSDPTGAVQVKNTAPKGTPSSDVQVDTSWIEGKDASMFSLIAPPTPGNPMIITADDMKPIAVKLLPLKAGTFSSYVKVRYANGVIDSTSIDGTIHIDSTFFKIRPESITIDYKKSLEFPATIEGKSVQWKDASITSFTATLVYDARQVDYVKNTISRDVGLDATWSVNEPTITYDNSGFATMVIKASGTTPIATDASLLKFNFSIYVTEEVTTEFKTDLKVSLNEKDSCVLVGTEGNKIKTTGCVVDLRHVKFSATQYALMNVTPHPATGGKMNIDFSLAFDSPTKIELVNSLGEVIAVPVDSKLKSGTYNAEVLTNTFSSGAYTIRMTTGGKVFTQPVVINN